MSDDVQTNMSEKKKSIIIISFLGALLVMLGIWLFTTDLNMTQNQATQVETYNVNNNQNLNLVVAGVMMSTSGDRWGITNQRFGSEKEMLQQLSILGNFQQLFAKVLVDRGQYVVYYSVPLLKGQTNFKSVVRTNTTAKKALGLLKIL